MIDIFIENMGKCFINLLLILIVDFENYSNVFYCVLLINIIKLFIG